MTIGYTILLIINTQALPLNNTIYPTQSQCEHQIEAMKDIHDYVLHYMLSVDPRWIYH